MFCRGNPSTPVLTPADSTAGLVGSWGYVGYVGLVGVGTACQVAVSCQVSCLCAPGTHGNGEVLPMASISQQSALQLNWCLSTLENVCRLGEVSAEWGNRSCSLSFGWVLLPVKGKVGMGLWRGSCVWYPPWRRGGTAGMVWFGCMRFYRQRRATECGSEQTSAVGRLCYGPGEPPLVLMNTFPLL